MTEPADTGAISLDDRLADASGSLSAAERRVAEVVVADRELVAFGTVARIAERAGTSGATVVRFADRLGYSGFRGLQESVRADLSHRLLPAAARIRRPVSRRPGGERRAIRWRRRWSGPSATSIQRRSIGRSDCWQVVAGGCS